MSLSMITDRTQADVEEVVRLQNLGWSAMSAEDKTKWQNGLKGAYNASDRNRVANALVYLRDLFDAAGYAVNIAPKTNWDETTDFSVDDLDQYISDIRKIASAIPLKPTTPNPPTTWKNMTYQIANDIEQILLDVEELFVNRTIAEKRCGQLNLYCGGAI